MKFPNLCVVVSLLVILVGCGGGGGGKSTPPPTESVNNSPTVTISGFAEVESTGTLVLTANATDSDGSIASYIWSVDSSAAITLVDATKAQVSFIAPGVSKDTTANLSVTVTDNRGATAKATKQVTIKSQKTSLTITGLVIDGDVIPNADLTFAVGDLTYKSKTDAAGQYTLNLSVDENHLQNLLVITAGDSTNPTLKLVSQLESISSLLTQSGSDKVLDASENIKVNVSNLTTAEFALLTKVSSVGTLLEINNEAQLKQALESVTYPQKIRLAGALQILAKNPEFKIPDAYKSTLDFIKDNNSVEEFLSLVEQKNPDLLEVAEAAIESNKNITGPHTFTAGKYIIFSGNSSYGYIVTFNEDGSGELISNNYVVSFKWSHKDNICFLTFPAPIETNGENLFITAAELAVADESIIGFAYFTFSISKLDSNNKVLETRLEKNGVNLINTSKTIVPDANKLQGEWFGGDKSFDKYQFNSDKILFLGDPEFLITKNYTWSINTHQLILKGTNGSTETLYLTQELGVGYKYIKTTLLNNKLNSVLTGLLIRPQNDLALKKEDMVGVWRDMETGSAIRVMATDGSMFTNFGVRTAAWNFIESQNTWEQRFYMDIHTMDLALCYLINEQNKSCELGSPFGHKIIARDGDIFYALNKQMSAPTSSYSVSVKLPKIKYFSEWFLSSDYKRFYQAANGGIKVWGFSGYWMSVTDSSPVIPGQTPVFPITLKNNNIHYVRDNVARELQLISTSDDGLTVCEFNEGSSCVQGTEFFLSNKNPAKISLKIEGSGYINFFNEPPNVITAESLFGNKVKFYVAMGSVKNITGCGSTLLGKGLYITEEIREPCTITAIFSQ